MQERRPERLKEFEARRIGGWLPAVLVFGLSGTIGLQAQTPASEVLAIADASFPVEVLVESPAATVTDLQAICLFRSDTANTLSGSLSEIDEKLGGLLTGLRKQSLFAGTLGETLLIAPKPGTLPARRLLIVGLGDRESFSPDREQLVGAIVYRESERLGIAHPFFAPTVLDGGKTGMDTGEVAGEFLRGFLRAKATGDLLRAAGVSPGKPPDRLTFLAGAAHASTTRAGLAKVFAAMPKR